jgi:hypothetical protein
LDASVRGAGSDTGINEGLCARENPDFNGSALPTAAEVATFGKAKGVVTASADWIAGFMLGPGADTGAPNPGKEVVAPPNRGLGGVAPTSALFSDNCTAEEGVRLNESELVEDGCRGAGALGPKLNEARGGPPVSKLEVCAEATGA